MTEPIDISENIAADKKLAETLRMNAATSQKELETAEEQLKDARLVARYREQDAAQKREEAAAAAQKYQDLIDPPKSPATADGTDEETDPTKEAALVDEPKDTTSKGEKTKTSLKVKIKGSKLYKLLDKD
jgi:multidrug efflux pump subunit AcrA (membrane-fusion protein)